MKIYIQIVMLLLVGQLLEAQSDKYVVKVIFKTDKEQNLSIINENHKLKTTFNKYGKNELKVSFPNAKGKVLKNTFDLYGVGDVNQLIEELKLNPEITDVIPYEIERPAICTGRITVNDSWLVNGWASDYHLDMCDFYCAWTITKGNSGIVIGIADTQFDDDHQDLVNQFVSITGSPSGGHPHGTETSSVADAQVNNGIGIAGAGYNSKIAGYCIPHAADGSAWSFDIKNAIWNAYQDGRPIINVSWTGTGLTAAEATEIVSNGTTLVLAAGNDENVVLHGSIANIPGVIDVSGVNPNNEHGGTVAHNQYVDLCAPFECVSVAFPNNSYGCDWGTSLSAPIVCAAAALMLDVNRCLNPEQIELILEENCDPIADAAAYPGLLGAGRLNAYKAVLSAIDVGTNHVDNLTLTNTQNFNGLYVASKNTKINNGANITFTYEKDVTLEPGFEVAVGGQLTVQNASFVCQ
jgi:hypothetical protein